MHRLPTEAQAPDLYRVLCYHCALLFKILKSMSIQQLLEALRAEHADRITIFASGTAVLYTKQDTFNFHSLADLEKNFGQAPPTCTCHNPPGTWHNPIQLPPDAVSPSTLNPS